jgi:MFS family permease
MFCSLWLQGIAVTLPSLQAEFGISETRVRYTTCALFVGLCLGAAFWGVGSDIMGRRLAFNLTLSIAGVFGIAVEAAPTCKPHSAQVYRFRLRAQRPRASREPAYSLILEALLLNFRSLLENIVYLHADSTVGIGTCGLFAALGTGVGGNLPVNGALFLEFLPTASGRHLTLLSVCTCWGRTHFLFWPVL